VNDQRRKARAGQWLCGVNSAREALRSGRVVHEVCLYRGRTDRAAEEIAALAARRGVSVKSVGRPFFSAFPKGHQGVAVRVGAAIMTASLEELIGISDRKGERPFYLIVDGIEDPRNLGSIIRTAEVAGVHGVILQKRRVASGETVAKASAGAVEYVPVVRVANIKHAMRELSEQGITIYSAEAGAGHLYWDADLTIPLALVVGSEGKGIRPTVRRYCDHTVRIPVLGRINSLNVSVATGILVYEVVRQRMSSASPDAPRASMHT